MRDQYKNLPTSPNDADIVQWLRNATRQRQFDLDDYQDQVSNNPYIYPVPSSSSDLVGTEKVGDIAADASYFYVVVDNAGTLAWRRVAISSF